MNKKIIVLCFVASWISAQIPDQEPSKKTASPIEIELPQFYEESDLTRAEHEEALKRNETKIRERIAKGDALETAIVPLQYIVGPGDVFSFNVWGPMEIRKFITVSADGKLPIPAVGEIDADGLCLGELQEKVVAAGLEFYHNSKVSLTLEALRFFRVHVVGEVKFPGAYIAQPVTRISELIEMAGGITELAWPLEIEIRHAKGKTDTFNLAEYIRRGAMEGNRFLVGGDVAVVRPISLSERFVRVEGSIKAGGIYQIGERESLYDFCLRIQALGKNSDLSKIAVCRETKENSKKEIRFPFKESKSDFLLQTKDVVILPSKYVYVKGAVRNPGAYPYVMQLTAKDYAGFAGGDYQSGGIRGVKVFRHATQKIESGPDVIVEAGDVVDLSQSFGNRFQNYVSVISALASLVIAGKAVGLFGNP
jgi:protein involved in polysaccharide export with SLBB domain